MTPSLRTSLGVLQWPALALALLFLLGVSPWLVLIALTTWLLHRFLPKEPRARRVGLVVEALLVIAAVVIVTLTFTDNGLNAYILQLMVLQSVAVVGAYEYLLSARGARQTTHELRLREQQLAKEVDAAHLQLLQAQVEPHFLFNTLAHVRRLSTTDVPAARAMLAELLQVLAEALPSLREPRTTLRRELALVRAYLALHQRRMGETRLRLRYDLAPNLDDATLPSTALLTLVENAVKHGIAPLVEGGEIAIRTREEPDGALLLEVADTGRGMGEGGGHGTGLANLRARLRALHGEGATLSLMLNEPRGLVARIRIPA